MVTGKATFVEEREGALPVRSLRRTGWVNVAGGVREA